MILSIRTTEWALAATAWTLFLVGCGGSSDEPGNLRQAGLSTPLVVTQESNPFDPSAGLPSTTEDLSDCLQLRLEVRTVKVGEALNGRLRVINQCNSTIALLTAPIEQRIRKRASDRFPVEDGINRVYAIAYLFRRAAGLGREAFRGDGGVALGQLPEYAVIPPSEALELPVTSKRIELEPGEYGLALLTIAVPVASSSRKLATIDLDDSVRHFEARERQRATARPVLPVSSIRFGPTTFFRVTPPAAP